MSFLKWPWLCAFFWSQQWLFSWERTRIYMNIRKNKETNNNKHTHTYKQRLNNQFHKGSMSAEESQGYVAETMYCIIFMKQRMKMRWYCLLMVKNYVTQKNLITRRFGRTSQHWAQSKYVINWQVKLNANKCKVKYIKKRILLSIQERCWDQNQLLVLQNLRVSVVAFWKCWFKMFSCGWKWKKKI